jgi:hypothetical protein
MKLSVQQALNAWESLSVLSTNADIPSIKGRYAISRAYDKLKPAILPIIKQQTEIYNKYYNVKENGTFNLIEDLKKDVSKDDYDKEITEFNEMEIEVDIYDINFLDFEDAKIMLKDKKISMPAIHFSNLQGWIEEEKADIKPIK